MERSSGWNMYVFRDGRRCVAGKFLLDGLQTAVAELQNRQDSECKIAALLWAGELECALADSNSEFQSCSAEVTDALADLAVSDERVDVNEVLRKVAGIHFDQQVSISPPEGFAYYALHPLNFAVLAERFARPGEVAGIVGIRSIGTTLSAIVAAALRARGMQVERRSVRPQGHPYDRQVEFTREQQEWVNRLRNRSANFIVVDEGPGISGSSFLSVGEALVREGVPSHRVTFFCSRPVDPAKFVTPNAVERYSKFSYFHSPYECRLPERGDIFIGNGLWRDKLLSPGMEWPGAWSSMERSKFLTADGASLLKFHGYGRFGREVQDRLERVAAGGFGPDFLGSEEGFGRTKLLSGRPATEHDLSREMVKHLAAYCAFRAEHMRSDRASTRELSEALRANWEFEFGQPLDFDLTLEVQIPVIADSKLQPHEWILTNGKTCKIDSETHGDDHFLPGPTDIAWDLAGAIIEWRMSPDARDVFLSEYRRLTNDDVDERIGSYLLAYSVFRFAYCKMGAQAMTGSIDEQLLKRDYERYRACAAELATPNAVRAA